MAIEIGDRLSKQRGGKQHIDRMREPRQKIRFSLRLLFIGLTLICVGLWWFWVRPRQHNEQQRKAGQALIHGRDRIYLESCFDNTVKNHLVTVLGDSRLTHWDSVEWIASPDSETVVSFGHDNALLVWNRDDGSIRQGYYDVSCAAYVQDGQKIFWADTSRRLHVSFLAKGKARTQTVDLTLPQASSSRLMCTADGKYLIHSGQNVPITVWAQESSTQLASIREGDAWPLVCTPDSRGVIVVGPKKIVEYELPTGQTVAAVPVPALPDGSAAQVYAAAFSPDGATLYLGDAAGRVLAFDWTRKEFREEFLSSGSTIQDLAAENNRLLVASNGLRSFHWWGEPRRLIVRPLMTEAVHATAFSPVAAAVQKGRIVIFDGDRPQRMKGGARTDATCFAFSPTSKQIAMAGRDGQIVIRETRKWELVRSWKAHESWIRRLVWSPAGNQLVSVGDGQAVLWDPETASELGTLPLWENLAGGLAFDATGRRLTLPGQTDDVVIIYKCSELGRSHVIPRSALSLRGDVVFSPDGTQLLIGGSRSHVNIWSLDRNTLVRSIGGTTRAEVRLATDAKGNVVFAATGHDLTAFDLVTGAPIWTLKVHSTIVQDVSRHPALPVLATVGSDGTVALVDADLGKLITRLQVGPAHGALTQVDFSPDGKLLAVAMNNGAVVIMQSMLHD